MISFQLIQSQFSRGSSSYELGECNLTYCSMAIGKIVAAVMKRDPLRKIDQLCIGDLMIEAFVYHGFAEILPPKRRDESYVLKAAPKWIELAEIPNILVTLTIIGSDKTLPPPANKSIHKQHEKLFNPQAPYVSALETLQKTKWKINSQVLKTIQDQWPTFEEPIIDNDAKEQKRRSKKIERKFIVGKAEVLDTWDGFYQRFELDYRGRMYNVEPFLNYQGNDLAKGMLLFYEERPITKRGIHWLAVHTATAYNQSFEVDTIPEWCTEDYKSYLTSEGLEDISIDKMTLRDRAEWTYRNMTKILHWANTDELHMNAEKPVVFLASCYEWQKISETGKTSLPVAIDGSNNGWQHLGAISKDKLTGDLVGLSESKIQSDFYVQTAKELISLAENNERLTEILKQMPMKHIRKGISKRGSMTRAYSAGAGKIAENMYFDCKTEDYHELYGITVKDCKQLAKLLIKAIENVCPGPLKTMAYLQALAGFQLGKHKIVGPGSEKDFKDLRKRKYELNRIKAKDISEEELEELHDISIEMKEYKYELDYGNGDNVLTWVTPSGFHALYEKYAMMDLKARATLNGRQIKHVLKTPTERPDFQGFMCGISPNYIHSLDASHMALIITGWQGSFGAVHDSFSTHASEVDELLRRTKNVFIEMYDHTNYFDVIRKQLTNNTDNIEQPEIGGLDIKGVIDSEYFFA